MARGGIEMKAKHILGTVTIVAIIGGTIYAIKKSKDSKKSEEQEISLAEAREIVRVKEAHDKQSERLRTNYSEKMVPGDLGDVRGMDFDGDYPTYFPEDTKFAPRFDGDVLTSVSIVQSDLAEYSKEDARVTRELFADLEDDNEEEIEDTLIIEETYPEEDGRPWIETMTEEDKVLRYEPSSLDALHQFKRMELAEWAAVEDTHQTLARLFEFPFQPKNDGDDMLRTQIIDYRVQFFGFGSRWAQQVSFADVILHYARCAEFNVGESVKYWVEYFLEFNDLYHSYSSYTLDEALNSLNSHTYFNEERQTFGLFGLTRGSMDQAIQIANRNIDRSVTYEIEFNEFLKSCL